MDKKLIFELIKKPHAYPEYEQAFYEAWGQITIKILTEGNIIVLFQTQWDLAELAEWFTLNQVAISNERLLINRKRPRKTESLSQALSRFFSCDFDPIDSDEATNWFETLDSYLDRHGLWHGLEGSKIPMIIVGLNHGIGEISLLNKDIDWQYEFDMGEFLSSFREEIRKFLEEWLRDNNNQLFQERISKILTQLDSNV